MQYPQRKFIAALAVGTGVRFTTLAFLGATCGRHIVRFLNQYYKPALAVLIGASVLAGVITLLKFRAKKPARATLLVK